LAYNEKLAQRIRESLKDKYQITEKRMFGGLSFLLNGNMCCGVINDSLMVRVGPDDYEDALTEQHTRQMDFTGRPLKGFVYVDPEGLTTEESLLKWIDRGIKFASSLPSKK